MTKTRAAARDYITHQRVGLQHYFTLETERMLLQATSGDVAWYPKLPLQWVVALPEPVNG